MIARAPPRTRANFLALAGKLGPWNLRPRLKMRFSALVSFPQTVAKPRGHITTYITSCGGRCSTFVGASPSPMYEHVLLIILMSLLKDQRLIPYSSVLPPASLLDSVAALLVSSAVPHVRNKRIMVYLISLTRKHRFFSLKKKNVHFSKTTRKTCRCSARSTCEEESHEPRAFSLRAATPPVLSSATSAFGIRMMRAGRLLGVAFCSPRTHKKLPHAPSRP